MNEEERRQIEEQIRILTRIENLETAMKSVVGQIRWGIGAIWGGIAYLAFRLVEFVLNGGTIK